MRITPAYIISWIAAGLLVLTACKKEGPGGCVTSTGRVIYEERALPDSPDSVFIYGEMDVFLTQEKKPRLYLKAGENLLPGLVTRIQGKSLIIEDLNTCAFLRDLGHRPEIHLTFSTLKYIGFETSGNIVSTNTLTLPQLRLECHDGAGSVRLDVNTDECWFLQHSGTGATDFVITGITRYSYIYCQGYGPFDLRGLQTTGYAQVVHRGSNHCYVHSAGILQAEIWQNGDIYYTGGPTTIWKSGDGTGQLIPLQP